MTENDLVEQHREFLDRCLKEGISLIGFDGNKLVTAVFSFRMKIPDGGFQQITDFDSEAWNKVKDDYQDGRFFIRRTVYSNYSTIYFRH